MDMPKLLIADIGEEFRQSLADQLRGRYRIRICREGRETLEMMLAFKPDLVVLDMMLPGMDGISIIEETQRCGIFPVILAVTKLPTDYLTRASERLGVAYMMVKPCVPQTVAHRLMELEELLGEPVLVRPEPRTTVSNILLSLGISTKLRGYAYLREAILEMIDRPGQGVTKELYPAVGKICGSTRTQVERSIRSAISKAWDQRDDILWRRYFGNQGVEMMDRPSNAVFITQIAERISRDPEIWQPDVKSLYNLRQETGEKL